ncbi:MAG: PocR ligand-binding domain-containing protein, partial [Pseudomonadota bacterium]
MMPAPSLFPPAAAGRSVVARLQQSALFLEYQQAFEACTGLPLALREAGSFLTPHQGSKRVNRFCALMTAANRTCAACLQLQQRAEEEAVLEFKTLQCYAGLSESAVPVRVGSRVIGFLQTGQVFLRAPTLERFEAIRPVPGGEMDPAAARELWSAYFKTRVVTRAQYESAVRLLVIFAGHLSAVSNELLIKEATAESPLITRVRLFITLHHGDQLGLRDVARAVKLSPYYFCKIFKHGTGLTFTEYLARRRIESAKHLLLNSHARISEAAYAAGFQ